MWVILKLMMWLIILLWLMFHDLLIQFSKFLQKGLLDKGGLLLVMTFWFISIRIHITLEIMLIQSAIEKLSLALSLKCESVQ